MSYLDKNQSILSTSGNMSNAAFSRIVKIAQTEAGIVLNKSKESMVKSRLIKRLRALNMQSFETYLDYLDTQDDSREMSNFISALTTNVSHFFREEHHFDYLTNHVLPNLVAKLDSGNKVRIWSAGCSNGQEPYSIAMTLLKFDENIGKRDIKILATDIDSEVLNCAKLGRYSGAMCTGLSEDTIKRFFQTDLENGDSILSIDQAVKDLISFKRLNLHADWPMKGTFDVIFCRNVVIYFDADTQAKLFRRYANILSENGRLMLGHSERLGEDAVNLFKSVAVTTYQPL